MGAFVGTYNKGRSPIIRPSVDAATTSGAVRPPDRLGHEDEAISGLTPSVRARAHPALGVALGRSLVGRFRGLRFQEDW